MREQRRFDDHIPELVLMKKKSGEAVRPLTEEKYSRDIYGNDVIEIPTNKPVQRKDLEDAVYKTKAEKYHAVVEEVKRAWCYRSAGSCRNDHDRSVRTFERYAEKRRNQT